MIFLKQAMIEVKEIKRMIEAMRVTKSTYLKNDYAKNIRYRIGELRYYCKHKGIDYNDIAEVLQWQEKTN